MALAAMTASLLTAFLFACSGICGQRSANVLGPLRANAIRLGIAMLLLGVVTSLIAPVPFASQAVPWLLASGLIGFGAGDVSLFVAYPHLGARLTLLINLCMAPIFGAAGEWLMTGARPSLAQGYYCAIIIAGVVIALSSQIRLPRAAGTNFGIGLIAAIGAGAGQGLGATLTRMAKTKAMAAGDYFTGVSEAFVRVVPGFLLSALVWLVASRMNVPSLTGRPRQAGEGSQWVIGAALFGPVLGVSCFQLALGQETSAVVLSITATAPIIVIPMAAYMDGERPGAATVLGSLIAVTGVVLVLAAA